MRSSAVYRVVSMIGLSVAGLIGGHALGYALAVPDAHHRAALVAGTGHGYIPSASWLAVVVGLAALLAGMTAGYVRKDRPAEGGLAGVAARTIPMQAGAFVMLEIFERLSAGTPLATFSLRLVVVGGLTQVLVAILVALLVAGLRHLGSVLAGAPRLRALRSLVERLPLLDVDAAGSVRAVIERVRAPPRALAA